MLQRASGTSTRVAWIPFVTEREFGNREASAQLNAEGNLIPNVAQRTTTTAIHPRFTGALSYMSDNRYSV